MTDSFLEDKHSSILVLQRRKYSSVVIGVPHHAPAGVNSLPCAEHEDADENAGFVGKHIADELETVSLIACNYPIDVNKSLTSDYSKIIAEIGPKYLIEIHGHGNKSTKGVEISSGRKDRTIISIDFATAVLEKSRLITGLREIVVCGDFDKIYFKATKSETIITDLWTPLHIELPPELRLPDSPTSLKPRQSAYYFADCIVHAIKKVCLKQELTTK